MSNLHQRIRRSPTFLAALWLAVCCAGGKAQVIQNQFPYFKMAVPDGFSEYPSKGMAIRTFATSDPADGPPDAIILVQRLSGTIGPQKIDPPAGATTSTVRWRAFELQVIAARPMANGITSSVRLVQIPLKEQAVQIAVAVPVAKDQAADAILANFLSQFDGPTSWNQTSASEQTTCIVIGIVLIVAVLAVHALLLRGFFKRRKLTLSRPSLLRFDSADNRKRRAMVHASFAGGSVFVLITAVGFLLLGFGTAVHTDIEKRAESFTIGAAKLSGTCFIVVFAMSTFILRRIAAKRPMPPPMPQAMPDFENIVDD